MLNDLLTIYFLLHIDMENPIVLGYWNSRNLAERVRLLL